MATIKVLFNDTPPGIAKRFTGDPRRAGELVRANAHKAMLSGTFKDLYVGETLHMPQSWRRAGLGDPTAADLVTLQADIAAIAADSTICAGANANVKQFQIDWNATGPATILTEDGLYGKNTAAAAATVTSSAPAACGPFGAAGSGGLTPVNLDINSAYTALVTDTTICSGNPNQNVINFQRAYNTWSGSATLAEDGIFGPETTSALNVVAADAGYGVFSCQAGSLTYAPPAGSGSTSPTGGGTVPSNPTNPTQPAASGSSTGLIVAGVVAVAAIGAFAYARKHPQMMHSLKGHASRIGHGMRHPRLAHARRR